MSNPHAVTADFECAVADYCDAPYCVAVNSCTMALLLAVAWKVWQQPRGVAGYDPDVPESEKVWERHYAAMRVSRPNVEIPKRTYVSVPMSIWHAGGRPTYRDEAWLGMYELKPWNIWDSARLFTSGQYEPGAMQCLSFHASKTMGIEQGGAVILDDPQADAWLRRARFDGRTPGVAPKDDTFPVIGWHCYMNPSTAAQGLLKMHSLPKHNAPLPNDDYPDLSEVLTFKETA